MHYIRGTDHLIGYTDPTRSWVVTPGRVKAEMDTVLAEGSVLNDDILSFQVSSSDIERFKKAWTSFWDTYKKFYDETGWFSRLSGSSYDKTVDYGRSLNDWRARFAELGGKPTQPKPRPPEERPEGEGGIPWKPMVISGSVVVALMAGGVFATRVYRRYKR